MPFSRSHKVMLVLAATIAVHGFLAFLIWQNPVDARAEAGDAASAWLAAEVLARPAAAAQPSAQFAESRRAERRAPDLRPEVVAALVVEVPAPASAPARPRTAEPPIAGAKDLASGNAAVAKEDSGQADYYRRVQRRLAAAAASLPAEATGEARVRFTVLADGSVGEALLLRPSGNATLDAAALDLPRQAAPLPAPPIAPLTLEVPIRTER